LREHTLAPQQQFSEEHTTVLQDLQEKHFKLI
jgi:hypothetical protein